MRTHTLALLAALLLLLVAGAGTAAADDPTQAVGQDSTSQQSATSNADATQIAPTNSNVDVRIFSPGDTGDVTQTNAAGALALAGNANHTDQSASQDQSGAGTQAVGQESSNTQSADADATAEQIKPSNENVSVRIGSPGDDGDVTQTNAAGAVAAAGNANATTQAVDQVQDGASCKCGGGVQAAGQSASNDQSAEAEAEAKQLKPSNRNISVRIDSPGDAGDVTQTNAALAGAVAGNVNTTTQAVDQSQDGGSCKCGGGVQAVGQDASSTQSADADAKAIQYKPSNENTSVRIKSAGDDGDVTQTNAAAALGIAFNANRTDQSVSQSQGGGAMCGCAGTPVQAVGQFAYNDQSADADATALQYKPSNHNTPVSIGGGHRDCGCGDAHSGGTGGDVTQANVAGALGIALNANRTEQSVDQSQGGSRDAKCGCGHGGGVQAAGQSARSRQHADASAKALQFGASNRNGPVRIGSPGGGGSVTQVNAALAFSLAANLNESKQEVAQTQ